jgi:transcriptional regulator with XRE-family HTH domain
MVRNNVRRLRTNAAPIGDAVLEQTLRALAEKLASSSHPLALNTISEIQNGARRVDVDDLVALAAALHVSPISLLLPDVYEVGDMVELPGIGSVEVEKAWAWMREGEHPDGWIDPWSSDNAGAFSSRPRRLFTLERSRQYLSFLRALLYRDSADGDVQDARERLERAERSAWRRLVELDLLPEQRASFNRFQAAYERMLIDLIHDGGSLDDWNIAARPEDNAGRDVLDMLRELGVRDVGGDDGNR